MSGRDVDRGEMHALPDLDDASVEALLGGHGRGIDAALADLVSDLGAAYDGPPPVAAPALAAFFAPEAAVAAAPPGPIARARAAFAARVAAAVAAATMATGGLAVAGALPGPVQNAVSRAAESIGVHVPDGKGPNRPDHPVFGTETQPGTDDAPGTADDHGKDVSGVATDPSTQGCDKGRAVSGTASGTTNERACPDTPATGETPPVSVPPQASNPGSGPPTSLPANGGSSSETGRGIAGEHTNVPTTAVSGGDSSPDGSGNPGEEG